MKKDSIYFNEHNDADDTIYNEVQLLLSAEKWKVVLRVQNTAKMNV